MSEPANHWQSPAYKRRHTRAAIRPARQATGEPGKAASPKRAFFPAAVAMLGERADFADRIDWEEK
jgi:hypothetical protein